MNIAISAFVSGLCIAARADTYQILGLSIDNRFVYGIYGSGAVVLESQIYLFGGCTPQASVCYVTYVNGLAFSGSDTPPTITDDGGPPGPGCPALPSLNFPPVFSFCNNGHEAYGVGRSYSWPDGSSATGVFDGPDHATDLIEHGIPGTEPARMNSYGDFVYDEAGGDEIIEAYDVTSHLGQTPEPGSWMLVATGALAAAAARRRRWG